VEDEPEVRSLVQKVLKMQGYTVLAAANAEEALRVSGDFRGEIEMMVCDVSMPGLSGKQLAERLAESRPETKVLFMSGYTDDTIVHHGILDPGIAFLQKPFTPQALARKVREVLETAPEEFKIS
jgi:DNA-binding response OmpR family regulator